MGFAVGVYPAFEVTGDQEEVPAYDLYGGVTGEGGAAGGCLRESGIEPVHRKSGDEVLIDSRQQIDSGRLVDKGDV